MQEAEGDAGEGAVGQGVAEERHAVADDQRPDRAADQADQHDGQEAPDVARHVEVGAGGEQAREAEDRLVEPVPLRLRSRDTPLRTTNAGAVVSFSFVHHCSPIYRFFQARVRKRTGKRRWLKQSILSHDRPPRRHRVVHKR